MYLFLIKTVRKLIKSQKFLLVYPVLQPEIILVRGSLITSFGNPQEGQNQRRNLLQLVIKRILCFPQFRKSGEDIVFVQE